MNIVIIRDDRLGDVILTLPIIRQLKENYPKSKITLIISSISRDLLSFFDFIDELIVFDNSINILGKLNSRKIDLLINFSPLKKKPYKFFIRAKKKINIINSSRYKAEIRQKKLKLIFLNLFFHKNYFNVRNNLNKLNHHTIFMNKVLNSEGIYSSNFPRKINLKLKNKVKYDYLIHLSNKWITKKYDNDNLVNLIEEIWKKSHKLIITTDLIINEETKVFIKKIRKKHSIDIFFAPKFKKWINLIDQSKTIITPECGCSHVCGILNKKSIIIYNSDNKPSFIKKEYHPYLAENIFQIDSVAGKKLNKKILSLI